MGSKRTLNNANFAKQNLAVTKVRYFAVLVHCSTAALISNDMGYSSVRRRSRLLPAHGIIISPVHLRLTLTNSSTGAAHCEAVTNVSLLISRSLYRESLDQEDIVAWINVGMHHLPQAEVSAISQAHGFSSEYLLNLIIGLAKYAHEHCDVEVRVRLVITQKTINSLTLCLPSFILSPLNFHDFDVSMDSSNAVQMNQDPLTGEWEYNEYDVKTEHCSPLKVPPLNYGNDLLYDLQGKPVDKNDPEREPWLRESQFPHAVDNWR